jgi:hypothetical protein
VPGKPAAGPPPRSWKKRLLTAAAVLLLLGGVVFAYMALRPDQEVAQLKELRAKMADKELSPEERREASRQFRQNERQLSDQQRYELNAERQQKERERLREFFSKPREDILAQIDQRLDRQAQFRQALAANGGFGGRQGGGGGGGGGGPGGGPGNGGGNGPNARGNPAAGGGNNPGAGPRGETRDQRQKNQIDATTPEDRAFAHAMRALTQQRMQARGMGGGAPPRGRP